MSNKSTETWVPLSRGLGEHIPDMNSQACRVYIYLLLKAAPAGKEKGTYNIFIGQLASDLKMHRVTLQKVIHEHLLDKYIKISGGENQHKITTFTIIKYKTVHDFACSQKTTTDTTTRATSNKELVAETLQPTLQAGNKQVTSTVENDNNNTDLQASNNTRSKELKKTNKKHNIDLPDYIDKETWNDYLDMRNKINKPATKKAQELTIKKLKKLMDSGDNPNEVLEQSIMNSYQGVFPIKERNNGTNKQNTKYGQPKRKSIVTEREWLTPEERKADGLE